VLPFYFRQFDLQYDRFGDGFCVRSTPESLRFSMLKVDQLGASLEGKLGPRELAEFEASHLENNKFGLFRQLTVYVDRSKVDKFDRLDVVKTTLQFYGSTVVDDVDDPEVGHVVVDENNRQRIEELKKIR
jgi:hypothetical protein